MKKVYNFLFGYNKKKFTAIVVLQFIGWIILAIAEEASAGILIGICWDLFSVEALGVVLAIIFGMIIGAINGFFINLILHVIELLENSASSLKVLEEKSKNNNTDNT